MKKITLRKKVVEQIRANARRGARALDKIDAGWFRQSNISLKRLDLSVGCDCVWGQLANKLLDAEFRRAFRQATSGAGDLGYLPASCRATRGQAFLSPEAQLSGSDFDTREAVRKAEFGVLQDEWETQIRLRRRAVGLRAAA